MTKPATADATDTYRPGGDPQDYQFTGGPLVPIRYTIRGQIEKVGDPAGTLYPFSARYVYLANGLVDTAEFYSAGSPAAQKRYRYAFAAGAYDAVNRLKSADFSSWNGTAWTATSNYDLAGTTYDAAGNLLTLQRNRETGTLIDNLSYTIATTSNRLTSVTDGVAATTETWDAETGSFSYDPNGNILTAPAPYSITAATYDPSNLPLSITRGGTVSNYRYDDAGQRIVKQVGTGNVEVYIREGSPNLAVFTLTSSGTLSSWYFNLLWKDRVIGRQPGTGSRSFYHFDALGSTRAVTQNATVTESYDFEPWGLLMPGRVLVGATKEGFTTKEQDTESGLDYFGARYYMPALGRWTSVDPLTDETAAWSPYVYVLNNPLGHSDPDGRQIDVKATNAYWDQVAIEGHQKGGIGGFFQALGATMMSTFVEYGGLNAMDEGTDKIANADNAREVLSGVVQTTMGVASMMPLPGGKAAGVVDDAVRGADDVVRGAKQLGEHLDEGGGAARRLKAAAPEGGPNAGRRPSAATRREVDARATDAKGNTRCEHCGQKTTSEAGHPNSREYDHSPTPYSKGGGRGPDNIKHSCRTCNRQHGNRPSEEWKPRS